MDEFSKTILSVFVLFIPVVFLLMKFRKLKNEGDSYPPGPRCLPILGYLPFMQSNLHKQFADLAVKYGPIFKLWLGGKLCIVVSSPTLIKEIVRDLDQIFSNRDAPAVACVANVGESILWLPYGQKWQAMRKLLVNELLSSSTVEAFSDLRHDEIGEIVKTVNTKIGTAIDVGKRIFESEIIMAMKLLWGSLGDKERTAKIAEELGRLAIEYADLLMRPNFSDFFPFLAKFDLQGLAKEMERIKRELGKLFDVIINERIKLMKSSRSVMSERRKDFLQILLKLNENEDLEVTIKQIKTVFLDILEASTDTSSTTVEWVMAELLQNPHMMKKVQQELEDVVGRNNKPDESHIPKLQYLEAVMKESFRLHSPAPLLAPKSPNKTCKVGGFTVPQGCRLILNMWAVHRDSRFWDDPLEFKPERFLNEPGKSYSYNGSDFHYLPFGSGRRKCPGVLLGERMVMHLLATIFHCFNWELPQDEILDFTDQFGLITRKKTPLFAVPYPRTQSAT